VGGTEEAGVGKKTVLVAGATGLVGQAAVRHFAGEPGTRVIALSRRRPEEIPGVRYVAADLTDRAASAAAVSALPEVTHVIFSALYERPGLVAGWQETEQIDTNDRMLRNLLDPLERTAKELRHVSLLQGTKAYGVHVRPMRVPAREGRSDARDIPNFYWNQEDYLRERQRDAAWHFSIFRPVLIVGYSQGSAMNLVPALGVYAALMKSRGEPLYYPGGPGRVSQAVDAGLLARAMAWAGESAKARNETYNVANGDVFMWPNVWPAIARAVGMDAGPAKPMSLQNEIAPCEAEWSEIRRRHGLAAPDLKSFVGLSFEYADYQMGYGRQQPAPPSFSSTVKLMQAGFHEVMDTETMLTDALGEFQRRRLLPQP
jgi:nucleoside-diphosphate-sugar epimerase